MLTVITGPMWSSKTDTLISLIESYSFRKLNVSAYTSTVNVRDGQKLKARNGRTWPCKQLDNGGLLRLLNTAMTSKEKHVYAIDEGQFFGEEILPLAQFSALRDSNLDMLVAGLTYTSEDEPFGFMTKLIAIANNVVHCSAWCQQCGEKATMTFSTQPKDGAVRVGDAGYEPRCVPCWRKGMERS